MSADNLKVLMYINMCCILPNDQKYQMKGGSLLWYLNRKFIVSFDCLKIL